MKILHVNYSDINGGAARASYRIHKGTLELGIDSKMLVIDKVTDDFTVDEVTIQAKLLCKVKNRISKMILKLQKSQNTILHCLNLFPSRLYKVINKSDSDIVHFHWVNLEMIDIKGIKKVQKPIVWTLHDSWAFCGAEHHPDLYNDNRYKNGYSSKNRLEGDKGLDLDRWTWKRKAKHWKHKKFHVVTPSNWLGGLAKESVLFKNNPVRVIHNGLDLNLYKKLDRNLCRNIFNLQEKKMLIGFGAMFAIADSRKGHHILIEALNRLPTDFKRNIELIVIGSSPPKDEINFGFKTHYLGHLYDDISLICFYNAIDIFISPSVLENLSSMLIESMSCATPCVAFNTGGTSDIIDHKENGYLAKPYEVDDLVAGIEWILDEENYNRLCQNARRKVEDKFDIKKVAEQYIDLYESISTA